jgi:apolipoprotein N-acyltransferase
MRPVPAASPAVPDLRVACGCAAASGVLLILPFLIPQAFAAAWLALAPLLLAIQGQGLRRVAALGLLAGTVAHLLGVYWLIGTMVRFGGIPAPISFLLYLLIATAFGTIYIPFVLACRLLPERLLVSTVGGALFIAAAFTASEFIFPGLFPWRIGYSQIAIPALVQIADVTGADGATFLVALGGAVLYQAIMAARRQPRRWPWHSVLTLSLLLALALGYGVPRLETVRDQIAAAGSVRVALLQPNVAFDAKFDPDLADRQIADLFAMSATAAAGNAELIIWPETGYRKPLAHDTSQLTLPAPLAATAYLYVGANVFEQIAGGFKAYNSVLAVKPDGTVLGRYDKHRLFPFGEYLPFSDVFPILKRFSGPISDFTAGTGPPVQEFPNGIVVGPLICYEDIFPDHSRQAVRGGARLLVNVTNDAWFGDTAAPHQHLQLALFRSIENRVPMARATNTGVTAIVSPTGEITSLADIYTSTIIMADIPLPVITTFYTRHGNVFAWMLLLSVLIVIVVQLFIRYHRDRDRQ